ncbi:major facilitator superfamily protein [Escherichia coli]|nr:major facilitator superfamily protein [Escherichia coli]
MSRLGAAVSTGLLPWVLAQWGNASHLIAPGDSGCWLVLL